MSRSSQHCWKPNCQARQSDQCIETEINVVGVGLCKHKFRAWGAILA